MSDVPDDLAGLSEALAKSNHPPLKPTPPEDVPTAEVLASAQPALASELNATVEALVVEQPIHTGSPFALQPEIPQDHLARGAALASLAIGLWGLATFWISLATIFNGLLGLFLGTWGIRSPERRFAISGLVTSLITLVVTLAWWTYRQSGR